MTMLNSRDWNLAARQFSLNRLVVIIGFLCGAAIECVVGYPAHATPSRSTDGGLAHTRVTKPNSTEATAAPLFTPTVAVADGRDVPVSRRTGQEFFSVLDLGPRSRVAASPDKLPLKDAESATAVDAASNRALPFAASVGVEAVPLALGEEAIAPASLDEPALTFAIPSSSAEALQDDDSTADLAQVPVEQENAETFSPAAPLEAYQPLLQFQAATIFQDDELSGRLRTSVLYALNEQILFGATVDLVGGEAFVDSADEGLSLNELYVAAAPFDSEPNLRFVGGLIDLTGYFDRNSFAKDVVTHFFHPVFQTNPALSAAGIGSRPGLLVNWSATDQLEIKAATFSSSRDLGELALDGLAAEAGFRTGNFILRGTVSTARDAGDDNGFDEIFQIQRGDGSFGLRDDDREVAYGLNAEYFIDAINLGLFGRYGWYENQDIGRGGVTFSFGANALDVFLAGDRLGLGYGQQLSNDELRSGKTPDVWEVFYDAPVYSQVRVGVSLQSRDEFSDTGLGFRVRADW